MTTEKIKTMNGEFNSVLNKEKMKRPCELKNSTLNLQQTLLSFNGRIGEERAWALCHQTVQCLIKLLPNSLQEITNLKQILLHQDGHVILDLPVNSDAVYVSEKKTIFSLGFLILQALDYGVDQKEEIILSGAFRNLLDLMTGMLDNYESEERLHETDDEGIGRDSEVELDGEDGFDGEREDCYTLKHIIQLCNKHIQGNEVQADRHYRAVMKAFVHEVLELTQFLEEVGSETFQSNLKNQPNTERLGTSSSQHLDTLGHEDWARFWYQVIAELRHGIKLKKVEENLKKRGKSKLRGAEFELTPYEILMDDIRERRYNLKKTPGPIRNVRKDARTVVLDFIRSRPPLKKASERQLPPLKKESTIRELLMESIKKPPRPLRSCRERQLKGEKPIGTMLLAVGGESRRIVLGEVPPVQAAQEQEQEPAQDVAAQWHQHETQGNPPIPRPRSGKIIEAKLRNRKSHRRRFRGTENPQNVSDSSDSVHRTPKKLIPVDFDLKLDVEEDDDDDDDDPDDVYAVTRFEDETDSTSTASTANHPDDDDDDDRGSANPWRKTGGLRLTRNEYHRFCDAQLESYDLATQCPSRRASLRKHRDARTTSSFIQFTAPRQKTRTTVEKGQSPKPRERTLLKSNTIQTDSPQEKKPSLGDMLLDERLSLTLEEIVHIRSVLTKAELESLPVEGRVKEDVEKRRVCFLCLKTRFGILGPWGQRCKLCERTICVKCYSKMKIPTEHFSHVPVVLLSPGLLLSPTNEETKSSSSSQWPRVGGIAGSAPASPAHRIRDGLATTTPLSTPNSIDNLTPRDDLKLPKVGGSPSRMGNSVIGMNCNEQRIVNERLRGVSMVVCHDCRIMVIQIIKSSRSTRATIRNNVISRLTLNLSPAYV